jgi:hypothetical protein
MGAIDQVLQRVEARRQVRIFGARLETPQVVGITATAHLHEQGIEIGAARPGDQIVDLRGCLEAVMEGIDPERAQLRRIEIFCNSNSNSNSN